MEGKVCMIQMPPSSWKFRALVLSSASTKTRAKALTTSEVSLLTFASCWIVALGRNQAL